MSTQRERLAPPSFLVSGPLKPAQLAAMEVAKEVWGMVGNEHRDNFLIVGGTALLLHGYPIFTNDADIAITAESLDKFETLAKLDPRFSQSQFGEWAFQSPRGFRVKIDFLDKTGETGCLHECSDYALIDGMPVTTLVDLAIGKGQAWVNRENPKDLFGFKCAVKKMTELGLNFRELTGPKRDALEDIMSELEEMKEEWGVLKVIKMLS